MDRYEEEAEDSDNETDPEQLLNEWLGELDSLTVVSLCFSSHGFFVILRSATAHNRIRSLTVYEQLNTPWNNCKYYVFNRLKNIAKKITYFLIFIYF